MDKERLCKTKSKGSKGAVQRRVEDELAASTYQKEAGNPSLSQPFVFVLLPKSANSSAPPDRTTPHPNDKPLHQITITYSTIAARALVDKCLRTLPLSNWPRMACIASSPRLWWISVLLCPWIDDAPGQNPLKIPPRKCSNFTWQTAYGKSSVAT